MKQIRLCCVVMILLLICISCNHDNGPEFISNEVIKEDETYFENVYLFSEVLKEYEYGTSCCRFYEDGFRMLSSDYTEDNEEVLIVSTYDLTGNLKDTVTYNTGTGNSTKFSAFTEDGGLLCMKYLPNVATASFRLYDSSFNLIKESAPVSYLWESQWNGSIQILENGAIVHFYENELSLFADMDAEPEHYNLSHAITDVDLLSDGTYLLSTHNNFFTLDLETGELTEWILPDTGKTLLRSLTDNETVNFVKGTVNYHNGDIYLWDEAALSVYRNGAISELIDFDNSGIDDQKLKIIAIGGDGCFYIGYQNLLKGTGSDGLLLYRTEVARTKPREIIRLASIGIAGGPYRNFLNEVIHQFNRDNVYYRIEWMNYDTYTKQTAAQTAPGTPTPEERNQNKFEEDLLAGITYDIYVMPESSENRILLAEKDILADMTPFLADHPVIGTVKSAYTHKGDIIAMPVFMTVSTLVTSESVLPADTPLTREALYALSDAIGEGEALFGDAVYENMKTAAIQDFVDADTKTCAFDSAEFIDYLTFLSEVSDGDHTAPALSIVDEYCDLGTHYYFLQSEETFEMREQNPVKLSEFNCGSADAFAAIHLQFAGQDIRYCGYPTDDGTAVVLSSDMLFSVSTLSASPAGASAFLSFLLDDHVQTSFMLSQCGLPVTEPGLEAIIPVGYLHFHEGYRSIYQEEHPDSIMVGYDVGSTPDLTFYGLSTYETVQITEEDRDAFIDFLHGAKARSNADPTLAAMIDEELSYLESGARSAAETGKILQGRVNIYINE